MYMSIGDMCAKLYYSAQSCFLLCLRPSSLPILLFAQRNEAEIEIKLEYHIYFEELRFLEVFFLSIVILSA